MNIKLSPSLLAADFTKLGEQLSILSDANTPYIHLDVMDGLFVPNISFGMPVIAGIKKATTMIFDVHLMIEEPIKYVEAFKLAGADIITFHVEATKDVEKTINKIKELGLKVGITLKPNTPLSDIASYLKMVDMVLIMTVEPGFGGQKFMVNQLPKIKYLSQIREEENLKFEISVDGGIDINNVRDVLDAGANVIVAGSAVLSKMDIGKAVEEFLTVFKEYE